MTPMEPIPETAEAVSWLSDGPGTTDLLDELVALADRAQRIVPDLVGVSITRLAESFTFTLVASNTEVGVLDAVQYLDGGPCVLGAQTGRAVRFDPADVLDEQRWQMFAEATAAKSVRSTLTLPLTLLDRPAGSVNLYGGSRYAFVSHDAELADVFGAWAAGAVTNADLGFSTLSDARATPDRVREAMTVNVATGLLASRLHIDVVAAEERLFDAAARADVSPADLARLLIDVHEEQKDITPLTGW